VFDVNATAAALRRPHASRSQLQHDGVDADVGDEYDPDSTSPRAHRYRSSRHRTHHGRMSKNRRDALFNAERVTTLLLLLLLLLLLMMMMVN